MNATIECRAALKEIRIVDVTKDGKDAGFSSLSDKLALLPPTGFVAVDTEFSGLVSDPQLSDENVSLRYQAVRRLADSRAIFSVGISLFFPASGEMDISTDSDSSNSTISGKDVGGQKVSSAYEVATYDFLMSCQDDFCTNANAGTFLAAHNFNFNHMFQKGIPYVRASTEKPPKGPEDVGVSKEAMPWRWGKMPRGLLWRIGRTGVPLVVHNGLFDLAFLYAAFQGPLPQTLNDFVGVLLECVPAGYWDSKMLAPLSGARASFLGYLYANAVTSKGIEVRNCSGLPADAVTDPPAEVAIVVGDPELCALYSFRGFCPRGTDCPFLHDPFLILEEEEKGSLPKDSKAAHKKYKSQSKALKKLKSGNRSQISKLSKKQKKKLSHERHHGFAALQTAAHDAEQTASIEAENGILKTCDAVRVRSNEEKVHTAGWDAFCTGYIFATYRVLLPPEKLDREKNKIALSKKLSGLFLCKSIYADMDVGEVNTPMKAPCPEHEADVQQVDAA